MSIIRNLPNTLKQMAIHGRELPSTPDIDIKLHLEAAIDWILRAREHSHDGGIPAFFDLLRGRWASSYPETTGYTIPTMFASSRYLKRRDLHEIASELADYLLKARTPEGGVGHWKRQDGERPTPVVFDTGQVIFGWLASWHETGNNTHLQAAVSAADWLVAVQAGSGAWLDYQYLDTVKVIDTRVAWALLRVAQVVTRPSLVETARRNLDWALSQQQSNGWFRRAGFCAGDDPFTHTIAYTAEGLLECGLALQEDRWITAAQKVAHALLERQHPDGSLASTYDSNWQPASRSSCLTGNCQVALLWLRLYGQSGEERYLDAARKTISFVTRTQDLHTSDANTRGAIAGSYPIYGRYERFKYPNWAAKFFVDALLALQAADKAAGG
ncbi:MAG: hypothetical protein GWN58_07510 [Anaerolineae bacterium]|nr:hypothetical protein [Anaerolineae bacterium]